MTLTSRTGRRQFLARGGTAAVALTALPVALASNEQSASQATCPVTLKPSDVACLRQLGAVDFELLVGQHFRAGLPGRAAMLRLVAVTRRPTHAADARPDTVRPEPFSLLFQATNDRRLDAAIHEFEHLELGRLIAYVNEVRVDERSHQVHYAVVFG